MSKLSYRLGLTLLVLPACSDPAPSGTDTDTSSSSSTTDSTSTTSPDPTTGAPTTSTTSTTGSTTDTSSTTATTSTTGSTTDTTTGSTTDTTGSTTDTSTGSTGSTTDSSTGVDECADGLKNGAETDTDCGGPNCSPCADGAACVENTDCQSESCVDNTCGPPGPGCNDGEQNGMETDIDCGGPDCGDCAEGAKCVAAEDCQSQVCTDNLCVAPECDDAVQNGDESDVDCGGLICAKCLDGDSCDDNGDCVNNSCDANVCIAPTCFDKSLNGGETDIDCGGPDCPDCEDGQACQDDADCVINNCVNNVCTAPACDDNIQNGTETGVDCGGDCKPCSIPGLVINEVDYDQPGTDTTEFVEILNNTDIAIDLAGHKLVFINGANDNDSTYLTVDLAPAGVLDPGKYVVVGNAAVVVPADVFKFQINNSIVQNGAPDGIALVNTLTGTLIDALSYDGEVTNANIANVGVVSLVEGTALKAIDTTANMTIGSLARLPNGYDGNNADTDWAFTNNLTPGAANVP